MSFPPPEGWQFAIDGYTNAHFCIRPNHADGNHTNVFQADYAIDTFAIGTFDPKSYVHVMPMRARASSEIYDAVAIFDDINNGEIDFAHIDVMSIHIKHGDGTYYISGLLMLLEFNGLSMFRLSIVTNNIMPPKHVLFHDDDPRKDLLPCIVPMIETYPDDFQ